MQPTRWLLILGIGILSFMLRSYGRIFNVLEKQGTNRLIGNVVVTALPYYLAKSGKTLTADEISGLRYKFFTNGNPYVQLFNINERTGDIRNVKPLKREVLCPNTQNLCQLHIDVAAFNSDNLVQIMRITVVIEDINDHWPTFPEKRYLLRIPESTPVNSSFSIPTAEDLDSKKYGIKTYRLRVRSPLFGLNVKINLDNSTSTRIIVKSELNREKQSRYTLEVLAIDGGTPPKTGTLTLAVEVTDINDNTPTFSKQIYNVTVPEDLDIGTTLMTIKATDRDIGKNSLIRYSFGKRTPPTVSKQFELNLETGDITLRKELNYETVKHYQILVIASDSGLLLKRSSQALLIVNVLDVNDNSPEINFNFLSGNHAEVSEFAKRGKFVAHVSVTDIDEGENARISCELGKNEYFKIEERFQRFQIILDGALDREIRDKHELQVRCQDNGKPRRSAFSVLVVKVLDENDHAPVFSRKIFYVSLYETDKEGEVILQLQATDEDIGPNGAIHYSIDKDSYGYFVIDRRTGIITTINVLDRETMESANIVVTARDSGSPPESSSATVMITVLDKNDVTPYFDVDSLTIDVQEEQLFTSPIGIVKAYDDDLDKSGQVEYEIIYSDTPDLFRLTRVSGELSVTTKLNREERKTYYITVIARDKGEFSLTGTATVTVHVIDINDHQPRFVYPRDGNELMYINTTLGMGQYVGKIKARDKDSGKNGKITYTLKPNKSSAYFLLDSKTGVIHLKKLLNFTKSTNLSLIILATDNGVEKKYSTARLTIRVIYINVTVPNTEITTYGVNNDKKEYGDNVVIVVTVVVVTLLFVIIIIAVICAFIKLKRRKSQDTIDHHIHDRDFSRATKHPDVVELSDRSLVPSKKRDVTGNVDYVVDHQVTGMDDNIPVNGYLNSYGATNSLTFLWSDPNNISSTKEKDDPPDTFQPNWKITHDAPSIVEDASSDSSENTIPSDSGRGGSEEGSARGHLSIEETEPLALKTPKPMSHDNYLDMTGKCHRLNTNPSSDHRLLYQLPTYLSANRRTGSDQCVMLGRLTPNATDRYADFSMPTIKDSPHGCRRYTESDSYTNSLDANAKKKPTNINNLEKNVTLLPHSRKTSFQCKPNPYTDFTSSSQLADVNDSSSSNLSRDMPGILSKHTHGSMPIRFKHGATMPKPSLQVHDKSQKCVRFETFKSEPGDNTPAQNGLTFDDDDATTTSGSYSIDEMADNENVTNV